MSDEVSEAKAGDRESGEAATVNENQKLATQEEQITKPAPKVKPQREKDPKKVAAGKKLAEKKRKAKAALEREVKREREIAEKEKENENSAGWLPEMSFQTVLSIVGVAFTAFEMYHLFGPKSSSGSAQSMIYCTLQLVIEHVFFLFNSVSCRSKTAEKSQLGIFCRAIINLSLTGFH